MIGNKKKAVKSLKSLLDKKCPFPKLDLLGKEIGLATVKEPEKAFKSFDAIINYKTLGSFVIVGQALPYFLEKNFETVMEKSREYIIKGNQWYFSDTIGHRTLGQSLVLYFDKTYKWLEKFLQDENKWVRKSAGIAIHMFSHTALNEPEKIRKLLSLIEPHIEEKQIDVVKGIGWGLKTIGKYYPDILKEFLKKQIRAKKDIAKLMMKKALTYLNKSKKLEVENLIKKIEK